MGNTKPIASTPAIKTQTTIKTTGTKDLQDLYQKFLAGTQRAIRIITKEKIILIRVAQFTRLLLTDKIECKFPASFSQRTCFSRKNQSANSIYLEASKYICTVKL
jgi:hypothetical protein